MPIPREREMDSRWASLALAMLTLAAALLRFPSLGAEDLWFDEVFSLVLASQDPAELIRRALADRTNPPGFYFALWGWARIGSFDPVWLRSFTALCAVVVVPATALLARALGVRTGGALLAAVLAAASPLLLAMSVEVRAYAPLALGTVVVHVLALRLARRDDAPTAATIGALAFAELVIVSLHYFGALVVAAALAATAWSARGRLRVALLAALPAAVALGAWLAFVVAGAGDAPVGQNAEWIPRPDAWALPSFASQVIGSFGTLWGAGAVTLAILLALATAARQVRSTALADERMRARWLLVGTLLPVSVVLVATLATGTPLWVARYLIVVLPPLWILVADQVWQVRPPIRSALVAGASAWACLAGPLAERSRTRKPAWSRVVRSLAGERATTLCVNEPFVGLPLEYHAIAEHVDLRVLEIRTCADRMVGDYALTRPGTEGSIEALRRSGAEAGRPRTLTTALPETELRPLRWPTR